MSHLELIVSESKTREDLRAMLSAFAENELGEADRRDVKEALTNDALLRAEYEDLRRPFNVAADTGRPFRAVWTYPPVESYAGKHVCEKPLAMIRDMVETSSRTDGVVCDPFAGSGVTLAACHQTGRRALVNDGDPKWADRLRWLAASPGAMDAFQGKRYRSARGRESAAKQVDMFAAGGMR